VDWFGSGQKLGFVKLIADLRNDGGESLPGAVFLRGGSVAMMVIHALFICTDSHSFSQWI
jgi:ADP-sugar diphosphatase